MQAAFQFPRLKFRLCSLFGIPLYLDFSLAFLLLMFLGSGRTLLSGLVGAAFLLLSITLHELGHALTARAFGYGTHDITLSLLGGCASLIALPRRAWQELLTALAGPVVSFLLAAAALTGMCLIAQGHVFDAFVQAFSSGLSYGSAGKNVFYFAPGAETLLLVVSRDLFPLFDALFDVACMNLMFGAFNLLPGFPMDGGRVFRSAMRAFMSRPRATFVAMIVGRVVAVLLAGWGGYRIYNGAPWGFVTLLIAWMVWREGRREYQQTLSESMWDDPFGGYSARVSPPPYGGKSARTEVRRGTSQ